MREATADFSIGDYRVARGTEILVSQWVMHRDPRYFAEPERFDPERWSDGLASRLPSATVSEPSVAGFACCHAGAGTEAGSGMAFVKFAAARPGAGAPATFARLLDACEAFAAQTGCGALVAGINAARHQAYRQMLDRGFRILVSGVTMLRPDAPAFNRPDCFVIDDLR